MASGNPGAVHSNSSLTRLRSCFLKTLEWSEELFKAPNGLIAK